MQAKDNIECSAGIGPSGCGKSTLLRMVAGLEEVSGGEILIGDRVVNDLEQSERDIAMVFQNYALYPHMTVADNMGFALKSAGTPPMLLVLTAKTTLFLDARQRWVGCLS